MRRVIIESPFAGETLLTTRRNADYLRECLRDSLLRGEAPFASHALYTLPGVLDDALPDQRELGITAGFAWREVADATIVYDDYGVSAGMRLGIAHAEAIGHPVELRCLYGDMPGRPYEGPK